MKVHKWRVAALRRGEPCRATVTTHSVSSPDMVVSGGSCFGFGGTIYPGVTTVWTARRTRSRWAVPLAPGPGPDHDARGEGHGEPSTSFCEVVMLAKEKAKRVWEMKSSTEALDITR